MNGLEERTVICEGTVNHMMIFGEDILLTLRDTNCEGCGLKCNEIYPTFYTNEKIIGLSSGQRVKVFFEYPGVVRIFGGINHYKTEKIELIKIKVETQTL